MITRSQLRTIFEICFVVTWLVIQGFIIWIAFFTPQDIENLIVKASLTPCSGFCLNTTPSNYVRIVHYLFYFGAVAWPILLVTETLLEKKGIKV